MTDMLKLVFCHVVVAGMFVVVVDCLWLIDAVVVIDIVD